MSCSWQEFYIINNDMLQIEPSRCNNNIPIILALAPGQNKTLEIKLIVSKTIEPANHKL